MQRSPRLRPVCILSMIGAGSLIRTVGLRRKRMRSQQSIIRSNRICGGFFVFLALLSFVLSGVHLCLGHWGQATLGLPGFLFFGAIAWMVLSATLRSHPHAGRAGVQGAGNPGPLRPAPTHHLVVDKDLPPLVRMTKIALRIIRLSLGVVLFFCTILIAGIIGQFSLDHSLPLGTRFLVLFISLCFALQSYAVCRILIIRGRARRIGPNFEPPTAPPGWLVGVPVPVRPRGPWLVRAAAQAMPREE